MTAGALTVAEVADRYAVDVHSVLSWIRSGELKAINVGQLGKKKPRWRIPPAAIEAFESARSAVSPVTARRLRRRKETSLIEFY